MSSAIDATVVIAWQNAGHIFHDAATGMLSAAEPPLVMSELNLAEVLVGLDPALWSNFVADLAEVGFVFGSLSALEIARARTDTHLRMPDACVIAIARAHSVDAIVSFDAAVLAAARADGFAANALP
jgi:predicted nucleic acid-binding protein